MNKKLLLALSLVLAILMLVGCSSNLPKEPANDGKVDEKPATDNTDKPSGENTTPEAASLKTGLAVVTSLGKSADAGEKDGLAQVDSTVVAVTVDGEGKIVECIIDAAQTKMNFSKEGKLVTDLATEFKSKNELGAEYDMAKASKIGKEWNEQAAFLANYVVGKTVEEVKGIAVAEGKATDADLAASVTVSVTGYINAIERAVASAQEIGAKTGDKLGLGIATNMSKSKDVADGKEGQAQAYSYYTALTTDADGKITSCIIDASQGTVKFDGTGKITSDLAAEVKTKNELGADYGMAKESKIGKEWNEQAAAFANYVVGKTLEEVKGIALTEGVPAADTDLAASVTVHVSDMVTIIEKAITK